MRHCKTTSAPRITLALLTLFTCVLQCSARSAPTKDEARLEQMLANPEGTDEYLGHFLSLIMKGDIQHKGMVLISMDTNADDLLSNHANAQALDWLRTGGGKRGSEPTIAPLLLRYCRHLPLETANKLKIDYSNEGQLNRTLIKAGLALGDPKAVKIVQQRLRSSDTNEVEFAAMLLWSNVHDVSVRIPLDLFEDALKANSSYSKTYLPNEAYLHQLFWVQPADIQERLSRVFSMFPETGYRLSYIIGINNILASPSKAIVLCNALKANPKAMLSCSGYYSNMGYGYEIASILGHGDNAAWFFQLMKESMNTKDDYRMSLLDVATALGVTGFDNVVAIPKDKSKYGYGKLNEKVDYLYTLRCGSVETRTTFLNALKEMGSFDMQQAFLKASLLKSDADALAIIKTYEDKMNEEPEDQKEKRMWRMYSDQRESDFITCFSHLQRDGFVDQKWQYFNKLTSNVNDAKSRYMLTHDLKGKVSYHKVRAKIEETLGDKGKNSVSLPTLRLLPDADLKKHRTDLEQLIGHFGLQAKMLSDSLASAGVEGYRYVLFRSFD